MDSATITVYLKTGRSNGRKIHGRRGRRNPYVA